MKSTTYFAEITTKKIWKVSVWERKIRIHLLARLLASCQLRIFPREFTENYFAVFNQSSCAIFLRWYRPLLFFPGFTAINPFMVWFQDSSQIKGRGTFLCLALSVNVFGRNIFFFFYIFIYFFLIWPKQFSIWFS